MSMLRVSLRNLFRGGAAVGALTIAIGTASAQAPQTPTPAPTSGTGAAAAKPEADKKQTDIIVITGSRLRQENLDSPNPVVEIGADEIDDRQVFNVIDVVEDLPLMGIGTNNRGTQTQNGDSFAFPDVLDLGTQRTLTLLNGHRVVASNPGSIFVPGNASGSQVDLSVFNPSIIERVDVLAGTGGAIYGADAVAGVVNLITKDKFEGLDFRASAGITDLGDGKQYRLGGNWGKSFMEDKAHIVLSADYFHQDLIGATADRAVRYGGTGVTNPYDGSVRNTADFSAQSSVATLLAGGAITTAFLPSASDGVRPTIFGPLSIQNPLITQGGSLLTGQLFGSGFSTQTNLVPRTPISGALARPTADPQGFAFFAPSSLPTGVSAASVISTLAPGTNTTGLSATQLSTLAVNLLQRNRPTPAEYFAKNPNINPLLFAGTFGTNASGTANLTNGAFPTIANTDPATSAIFPRLAVPLKFDASGNLVPLNLGTINSVLPARLGQTFGGDGYDSTALGHTQLQAGTERIALASLGSYDFTDWLRLKSTALYTNAKFDQIGGTVTQSPGGSAQAGSLAVPIYVDQNPYVTSQAKTTINTLAAQGATIPTLGGQRVLYEGRALTDVLGGGTHSKLEVQNFQITEVLEGDFNALNRDFYWEVAGGYGRSDQKSSRPDLLDVEFALATDVVTGANGQPVCRQQTLAAPESIAIRNPGTSGVVLPSGLVPTAAQVAACKPLNLLGSGAPSADAINYVVGNANVHALNTLKYYSGSLGGEILRLPAGPFNFGLNAEHREESIEFEPSKTTQFGLGRTAPQGRGVGTATFNEYGYELNLPVFGGDFTFPLMKRLDFTYAFRIVERDQSSSTVLFSGSGTKDDTFNYSFSYQPFDDLTIRGARSRAVRSASLVELVGPFTVAFTTLAAGDNPCTVGSIGLGPDPATRRANCLTAVQKLGIAANATDAATFLSTFNGTGATRPANAGGNPGLINEEANNYTLGFTWQPSAIPRLTVAVDFYNVDLKNEISLFGPGTFLTGCFDSKDFPNSISAGTRACDTFLYGTQASAGGVFNIATTNALTGNPGTAGVLGGSPAAVQAPFELAFAQFANLNSGGRSFRGVNTEVRYDFQLGDLPFVGNYLGSAGEIFLKSSYFNTQRYDLDSGIIDPVAGEHGNPEHVVRTEIRHRIGGFDHSLQWYWNSATVSDVQVDKALYPERTPSFFSKAFNFFNYAASYKINDMFVVRATINNLFNTQDPRGIYGISNRYDGGIGREFVIGLNARF